MDMGTMGWGALGLQAAGTLMGAFGAQKQAAGQKAALEYQSQINRINAQIAEWSAGQALIVGQQQVNSSQLKTAGLFGAQRAALAGNGVDLGEGSATDILATTKYMGKRDALTIEDNATRTAWAYRNQGVNYTNQAGLMDLAASNINPEMAGLGTLLTGAGQVAGSWYMMNRQGVFSGSSGGRFSSLTDF